jgi:hypothetical protein
MNALYARRTEEGMEPDDLLCSRNARPQKALVGRAQWKINQPPSLNRERASVEGSIRWMTVIRCVHLRAFMTFFVEGSGTSEQGSIFTGCSKRPSSKAAASEDRRRTLSGTLRI